MKTKIFLWAKVGVCLALWFLIYGQLDVFASWAADFLPSGTGAHLKEAVRYFLYDAPKVLMLLVLIVFVMGVVRSYFSAERARKLLSGKRQVVGTVFAALLGVVTPFCSCSAVPMFIGFVSAGVPLGVTFAFLISAPMVNEVALGLLLGLVGWKVAALYFVFGLMIAIVSGLVLGRLKLDRWLEDWVRELRCAPACAAIKQDGFDDRLAAGKAAVREIVGKVWPWVLAGVGLGALIHGYVPEDVMASIMGPKAWWSVPLAVVIGIPMYANHAGILPIATALLGKGAALGTVLAFMMAVTALSLPEMIILRKVLKLPLIAVFVGVTGAGILAVGYLFNLIF